MLKWCKINSRRTWCPGYFHLGFGLGMRRAAPAKLTCSSGEKHPLTSTTGQSAHLQLSLSHCSEMCPQSAPLLTYCLFFLFLPLILWTLSFTPVSRMTIVFKLNIGTQPVNGAEYLKYDHSNHLYLCFLFFHCCSGL